MHLNFCKFSYAQGWLLGLAAGQAALYGVIAWLSPAFEYLTNAQPADLQMRPILATLGLFGGAILLYLASLAVAIRCSPGRKLFWAMVVPALVFRANSLFSTPIQEIDIYRYIWDGAVASAGVSPFRYTPQQVQQADVSSLHDGQLKKLAQVRDESPSLNEILHRIHFAELPTVYPPVSQVVFTAANLVTPAAATLYQRVTIMKAVLLLFDIGTILVVWRLLLLAGRHPGWTIAYAWCPLVMKEFANSGHLDAIAVFLATAGVWSAAKIYGQHAPRRAFQFALAGAVLLGLAVGAKLYAIVLLPLLAAACWSRIGAARATAVLFTALLVSGLTLAPMLLPPGAPPNADAHQVQPLWGLQAFLSRWEMNDFLFLVAFENIRPPNPQEHWPDTWFAVTPPSWRAAAVAPVARELNISTHQAAFLLTRLITTGVFAIIALSLAWRAWRRASIAAFLEAAFLTLAWFWLLSPTQNPWYWIWALPLIPFARGRAWLALAGLLFLYYLRFWLEYQYAGLPVAGTTYHDVEFFDLVITWLEYAPWFALLLGAWIMRTSHVQDAKA